MVQEVKEGKAFYTSLIQRKAFYTDENNVNRSLLTPSTAVKTYKQYAGALLDQLGIPRDSRDN